MFMPKPLLVILALITLIFSSFVTLYINNAFVKSPSKSEIETAINQAQYFYRQKKGRGEDLSTGPCLTESLMPDWVVDIVHNPRQPIDDLGENQCQSFREGRSKHFVELDLNGNLVKVK